MKYDVQLDQGQLRLVNHITRWSDPSKSTAHSCGIIARAEYNQHATRFGASVLELTVFMQEGTEYMFAGREAAALAQRIAKQWPKVTHCPATLISDLSLDPLELWLEPRPS